MSEDEILIDSLQALYEAPLDPSFWHEFLRLVAIAAEGEAATLLMHDFGNAESAMSFDWGFHPDVARLYAAHYGAIDVWRSAVTKSRDWIGISEHFVPTAELLRTEFYNDLLLPYEIPHGMFAMVERGPSRVANLSVCRSARAGAFEETHLEVIRFLKPHIQRAYRLHSELISARARNREMMMALDSISTGVILIGPKVQVLTMNRAAERTIAAENSLRVTKGRLRVERTGEMARLEKLLMEAVTTSQGTGLDAAGAMTISRRDLQPLKLLVSPVRGLKIGTVDPVRALVFISDPAQQVCPTANVLRDMFGLTPAECRLAFLLSEGKTLCEIAEMLRLTRNTLKSQLASIYRKTRTSRQSQLIMLLLRISTPTIHSRE